jgi:phosphatidylglycerophosphate synthase
VSFPALVAGWSRLHGLPASGVVTRWLRLVHPLAYALRAVPPLALTALGLLLGVLCWPLAAVAPVAAAVCVLAGAGCDALDGAVAVLSSRISAFGALADRCADRATEAAYALAFWTAGAPLWACLLTCLAGYAHEAVRRGSTLITVAERPTRVLFAFFGLVGAAVMASSPRWVVLAWLAVAVAGLGQAAARSRRSCSTYVQRPPQP